ncbi:MAG TPA: aminodeoxychorismate synthase component I [Rudaea sp.]|nr:aminodeoxychorismate synthase component I [Rudaea sp.]
MLRALEGARDLLPLAAAYPRRYPCLLESAVRGPHARCDILFAFPQGALSLAADGLVRDANGERLGAHFLETLDAAWRAQRCVDDEPSPLPFRGGWAVFLAYELAAEIEPGLRLPAHDSAIPRALALRCPAAIVVDRDAGLTWLVAEREHAALIDALRADLDTSPAFVETPLTGIAIEEDPAAAFIDGVSRVHEYLRAGDTFQVNLSRGWRARFTRAPAPAQLYARLRRANPAPFAGLLQWNDWAVASSSPERLVELRGGIAQTRPIAGTRPRMPGDDDALHMRELAAHPKERAEHVMLVDLERNDLGRVCEPGSVVVDELMTIESYAHVHHIVSNVRGRLRRDASPVDAIRATFPGGTITGCPKVRTMEIIAELERTPRGAYTGALGYLGRDGSMDLNILIRTLAMEADGARFRAGAGIVADSDARRELEETRAKARGLLRALGAE